MQRLNDVAPVFAIFCERLRNTGVALRGLAERNGAIGVGWRSHRFLDARSLPTGFP
ncbi:MAG: hypothetical protein SVX43_01595 [Cyanobacteriota bacterium]|nr:hypothetical protein [Cyanobacteriota bacterium]